MSTGFGGGVVIGSAVAAGPRAGERVRRERVYRLLSRCDGRRTELSRGEVMVNWLREELRGVRWRWKRKEERATEEGERGREGFRFRSSLVDPERTGLRRLDWRWLGSL